MLVSLRTPIPGREDRTEGDTEMHSGSEPRLYVLVPTRPGTRAEADPLLSRASHHGSRRRARRVQCLQVKQRELSSHAGVCQPLPDICVFLRQQLLHGATWPPALCAKRHILRNEELSLEYNTLKVVNCLQKGHNS